MLDMDGQLMEMFEAEVDQRRISDSEPPPS